MNEPDLRALVREAVQRHLGRADPRGAVPGAPRSATPGSPHVAHALYLTIVNTSECVIEPSVTCDHCGYCKAHGF